MKLIAFLQLYNELSSGNLLRCLDNCKQWAEEIFIYDDRSDDGSYDAYLKYTDPSHIIVGKKRNFSEEIFHKKELLNLALKSKPDWIGWIDGDAVLSKWILDNWKTFLPNASKNGYDGILVHNMNLWRHPAFYRIDNKFDRLWHMVFWRNNGNLHYKPTAGLHQHQYPLGIKRHTKLATDQVLLHYGFASETAIARKYLTYKSYGQKGWELDRLIDEQSSFEIHKVEKSIYPDGLVPDDYDTVAPLSPISFNEYRKFKSWEEFCKK
jgi:glycosyltransferase involved in cell wall biosynthesis